MAEEIIVNCPCCGMKVPWDQIGEKHEIKVWRKTFGGRRPNSKRGIIEWDEIEDEEKEKVLKEIKERI